MSTDLFPDLPTNKTRLERAKETHAIETHDNGDVRPDTDQVRWLASITDGGPVGYGATEADAVLDLARKLGLVITL